MGKDSAIQWTDSTCNLWWGCVEVSPGCDHCYAKTLAERWGRKVWGVHEPRYFTKNWKGTLASARNKAIRTGVRQRVFVQSMSDICEVISNRHPDFEQMERTRKEFFEIAEAFDELDFQLLTKRVGNYAKVVPGRWLAGGWPAHIWAGISVVNQAEADRDIPKLLGIPAPVHFLSVEPQLGPIDFDTQWLLGWGSGDMQGVPYDQPTIDWVIVGGESGPKARPFDTDWARSIIRQCSESNVACFIKQMGQFYAKAMEFKDRHGGDWDEWLADLRVRQFPEVA